MTDRERLFDARRTLAERVGLDTPFTYADMAAILRIMGSNSEDSLRKMESGAKPISGPITQLLDAFDAGFIPAEARQRSQMGRHSRRRVEVDDDEIARAVHVHGSKSAAARALGISVSVVSRRTTAAAAAAARND